MKNTKNIKGIILIIAMILMAAFSRLIPHLPNFTAVGAMALFGSAYFNKRYLALISPILAMWLSDLVINNVVYAAYNESFVWFQSFQIYTFLPLLLITVMGFFLFKKVSTSKVIAGSIVSAVIFFVVSNFGTWLSPYAVFPHNFAGLVETYVAGIPFLGNNLMGTLFFSTIMFGAYYFITKSYPTLVLENKETAVLS